MRAALSRLFFWILFRLSRRTSVEGVEVGLLPGEEEASQKLTGAIELLAKVSPADFHRMRRLVRRVLVIDFLDAEGEWQRYARTICVRGEVLAREAWQPGHIAALLVHETTHAWLDAFGFAYIPSRRGRIEAICFRRQARFASRLGATSLEDYYLGKASAALTSRQYEDSAFTDRRRQSLVRAGMPQWIVRLASRVTVPDTR